MVKLEDMAFVKVVYLTEEEAENAAMILDQICEAPRPGVEPHVWFGAGRDSKVRYLGRQVAEKIRHSRTLRADERQKLLEEQAEGCQFDGGGE